MDLKTRYCAHNYYSLRVELTRGMLGARSTAGHGLAHPPGSLIATRVTINNTRLIGKNHQQIRFHQIGHQRRESIVIAKAQFIAGNGVVFINDRNNTQAEQFTQRTAGIEVTRTVNQVIVG